MRTLPIGCERLSKSFRLEIFFFVFLAEIACKENIKGDFTGEDSFFKGSVTTFKAEKVGGITDGR